MDRWMGGGDWLIISLYIYMPALHPSDSRSHFPFPLHYEVSLRLQVVSEKVVEKTFGEYVFCCLLLFFVVFNFIG